MAAGMTYEPIATTTLSTGTLSYTFSNIPGTYTDLVLVSNYMISGSEYLEAQFNGDTGSNYGYQSIAGGVVGYRNTAASRLKFNYNAYPTSGQLGFAITNINSYANTTTYKTTISQASNGQASENIVCTWNNTAAITSIQLINSGVGNFLTGSTFTLYGIKAA